MARKYIIIVGCGRLGAILANRLSKEGHSVVVIDRDADAFRKLSPDFSGYRIHSNTVEIAALREAQIERADCLLAITDQDNVNMMVAQVARTIYGVPVVLARVYEPAHEIIYHELDVKVISPTHLAAGAFLEALEDSF
ncbi:MAG TPA: TrkA family potassium uptake protein [Candidatus Sulfomarinibacteraceae bacterium]|nr:TrkA family potassium uptake protein [Candidatus Sulfomarinibacteraceae bacterium]